MKPETKAIPKHGGWVPKALADLVPIVVRRLPRQKCDGCRKRRVLFVLTVYGESRGMALCAICAQLR